MESLVGGDEFEQLVKLCQEQRTQINLLKSGWKIGQDEDEAR